MKVITRDLLEEVTINDLPEDWQFLAELCGLENVIKIITNFRGDNLYIPVKTLTINIRNKYIAKHFNGENAKELATKFGITIRAIYKIAKKNNLKKAS